MLILTMMISSSFAFSAKETLVERLTKVKNFTLVNDGSASSCKATAVVVVNEGTLFLDVASYQFPEMAFPVSEFNDGKQVVSRGGSLFFADRSKETLTTVSTSKSFTARFKFYGNGNIFGYDLYARTTIELEPTDKGFIYHRREYNDGGNVLQKGASYTCEFQAAE